MLSGWGVCKGPRGARSTTSQRLRGEVWKRFGTLYFLDFLQPRAFGPGDHLLAQMEKDFNQKFADQNKNMSDEHGKIWDKSRTRNAL